MTEAEAIADLERQIAESEWRAGAAHERRIWRMAIERYFDGPAVDDVEGYVEEFRKFVEADCREVNRGVSRGSDDTPPTEFLDWFRKNYPGPDTIIFKPDWHAPKIWRAAMRCMEITLTPRTRTQIPRKQNKRKSPMKTRDEAIRDLAGRAEEQCEALADKMTAVIDEIDDEGDPEYDTLRGIAKDSDGRAMMVFKPEGSTARTPRYVVYVDAILALSKLLNGEVQVQDD